MYLTECMIDGQMMNNLKITFTFIQFDQQNFGYVYELKVCPAMC